MNKPLVVSLVVVGILVFWIAGSKLFLRNIEILGYEVEAKQAGYEIRQYNPYLAAQTTVPADFSEGMNSGFRVLADYIFGNNTKNGQSENIAMTTPVIDSENIAMTSPVIDTGAGGRTLQFVLPAKYTRETLPTPNNDQVQIIDMPGGKYAAIRYTGLRTKKASKKYQQKLFERLDRDQVQYVASDVSFFYYDPPSTFPWVRRNEVLVRLK